MFTKLKRLLITNDGSGVLTFNLLLVLICRANDNNAYVSALSPSAAKCASIYH